MSLFPENKQAELQVKKIMLVALLKEKEPLENLVSYLNIEVAELEREIKRLRKEIEE